MTLSPAWNRSPPEPSKAAQPKLIIEDVKPAAWNNRRDVTAGKAQVGVGRGNSVGQPIGFVTVRINGIGRAHDGTVITGFAIGNGKGNYFIQTGKGSLHAPVEAVEKARRKRLVWRTKHGRLLKRTANFAASGEFTQIIDAATQLLLGSSTSDHEARKNDDWAQNGKLLKHIHTLLRNLMRKEAYCPDFF